MMKMIKDLFQTEDSWLDNRINYYLSEINSKKLVDEPGSKILTKTMNNKIKRLTKDFYEKETKFGRNRSPKTIFTYATDFVLKEEGYDFKKREIANWTGIHKKTYRDYLDWVKNNFKKEKIPKVGD